MLLIPPPPLFLVFVIPGLTLCLNYFSERTHTRNTRGAEHDADHQLCGLLKGLTCYWMFTEHQNHSSTAAPGAWRQLSACFCIDFKVLSGRCNTISFSSSPTELSKGVTARHVINRQHLCVARLLHGGREACVQSFCK